MNEYKLNQLKLISKQIQTRINDLQNPTGNDDCYSKRKKFQKRKLRRFVCQLDIDAGFASGIHEILFCFVYGFFTKKTVILNFKWNKYIMNDSPTIWDRLSLNGHREKWDDIFMTLNDCQQQEHLINQQDNKDVNDVNGNKNQNTIDKHDNENVDVDADVDQIPKVINMPNDVLSRSLMNYLPKEFGEKLIKLTETPNAWFHSQFIGYIMRPSQRLSKFLDEFKHLTGFHNPIVGIQVRRTDKVSHGEAMYHRLDDYMLFVQDFYDGILLKTKTSNMKTSNQNDDRLVYIASDDSSILSQFKLQYPNYKFISSSSMTSKSNSSASSPLSSSFLLSKYFFKSESLELFLKRYTNESLWALLTDVYLLAQTDHLVCTFSSAVSKPNQLNEPIIG